MSSTYTLVDSGNFEKLEKVGPITMVRPSASAVWDKDSARTGWTSYDVRFDRDRGGEGEWTKKNKNIPDYWDIEVANLKFRIRLTGFGHLGIFPEQCRNWLDLQKLVAEKVKQIKEFRVLNLFAYTGGSTMACAKAGAFVTHVDASKTSVNWAKENAGLNQLSETSVRWMVDDVSEFVAREVRRGNTYHGIILDPPSFGRGTKKQVWKIEEDLMPFMERLKALMADDFQFCLLSSHSPGHTPVAHSNQLRQIFSDPKFKNRKLEIKSDEMILPGEVQLPLPSGSFAFATLN